MNNVDFNNGFISGIAVSVIAAIVLLYMANNCIAVANQREAIRLNLATYDEKGCFIWKVK